MDTSRHNAIPRWNACLLMLAVAIPWHAFTNCCGAGTTGKSNCCCVLSASATPGTAKPLHACCQHRDVNQLAADSDPVSDHPCRCVLSSLSPSEAIIARDVKLPEVDSLWFRQADAAAAFYQPSVRSFDISETAYISHNTRQALLCVWRK